MENNPEREKMLAEMEKNKLLPIPGLQIMKFDEVSLQGFILLWVVVVFFITGVKILANLGGKSISPAWYALFSLSIVLIAIFSFTTTAAIRRSKKKASSR